MKSMNALLPLALLTGCATTVITMPPSSVKEALAGQVKDCQFIQTVSATSPLYGIFAGGAMQDLRASVFSAAEKMKATHVVFTQSEAVYGSTSMHAQAFNCK